MEAQVLCVQRQIIEDAARSEIEAMERYALSTLFHQINNSEPQSGNFSYVLVKS